MIVKMKKLTLICTAKEQDRTLDALRDLKAVHIEHLESPSGLEIDKTKQGFNRLKKSTRVLQSQAMKCALPPNYPIR